MKALMYVAPERMELRQVPEPVLQSNQVLLRVAATGICGSDVHGFLGHSERRKPGLILGHEAVATIAQTHETVSAWKQGQRVAINPLVSCGTCAACASGRQNLCERWWLLGMDRVHGTFAEYVAAPATQLYAVSDDLSETEAVFTEPLANIVHMFRISMHEIPESLVIYGAGPIGSLALALAKLRGIANVIVIDKNEKRLEVSRQLKADHAIDSDKHDAVSAVRKLTGGGADFVIDAVGADATRRGSVACCRRGGRIVMIGMAENESALPWIDMIRDEKSVFTTFCFTPRDFETSLRLLESRRLDLTPWTELRPLEEGQASFMKMTYDPGGTLKLIFKP
ncbi:MAG TPA: alcohol dehydrogenase catalytic domain-containing protein [Planctomycetota bacterium]|nr:alcohol dehydrogenase catalytic domain-containing protein [Planctomycetota bacterium]